jgi:clan AA aspartic protease (TIGR02281 family)
MTLAVALLVFAADDSKALEALKEKGLKGSGGYYIVAEETELSKGLSDLRALERSVNLAQKAFTVLEKQRAENDAIIAQLTADNRKLRDLYDRTQDNFQSNRIINKLNSNLEELNRRQKMSFDPDTGKEVRGKLSKVRDEYLTKVMALRKAADAAKKKYEELAGDASVKSTIEMANKEFEREYELGPSKAFAANLKTLEKLEAKVLSESIALRKEANTWRIDVVLNGKGPKPMVFDTGASSISLPYDMAKDIGLDLSDDAPKVSVSIADGSTVTATKHTIDTVRVGKFEASNVECLVMPANFTNVPPLLGGAFINRFNYKMDPDTGKLTLSKLEGAEEPKSTKKAPAKKSSKKP